jgi:membrane-bound lytic murein transglycosylase B
MVGATLVIAPVVAPIGSLSAAHASPDPATTVQEILAKVADLQSKARIAERKYEHVFADVANSVDAAINADQSSSALAVHAAEAQSELNARIRGLYESGGTLTAYAQLLTSGNLNQAASRTVIANRVIAAQVADVRAIQKQAALALDAANQAHRQSAAKIRTARNVMKVATRVQHLLNEQRTLLAKADQRLAAVKAAQAALGAQSEAFSAATNNAIANLKILAPSDQYVALYKAAAGTCPGLSWTVLAAVGQVESGHGRNPSTSSAGAMGPMQFMPSTFAAYAVDGDKDGSKSIMDPADALFSAAHYLCANGAGRSASALSRAIWHYNHAAWYVAMVLKLSGLYAAQYR